MSDRGNAVFLGFAAQDAGAAGQIGEALRPAGVEVWFDQSDLVGGDAWNQKVRKQSKAVPPALAQQRNQTRERAPEKTGVGRQRS